MRSAGTPDVRAAIATAPVPGGGPAPDRGGRGRAPRARPVGPAAPSCRAGWRASHDGRAARGPYRYTTRTPRWWANHSSYRPDATSAPLRARASTASYTGAAGAQE